MSLTDLLVPTASYMNIFPNNISVANNLEVLGNLSVSGSSNVGGESDDVTVTTTLTGAISDAYIYHVTSLEIDTVKHVTLHLPADVQSGSMADVINITASLPVGFLPVNSGSSSFPIIVNDSNVLVYGTLTINGGSGAMSIGVGAGSANFGAGSNCGLPYDVYVSWDLSSNV